MPTYEYCCDDCGPFTAVRPMAEFSAPQACPDCGAAAGRNLLSSPLLANPGERNAGKRPGVAAHSTACGCCRPSRGLRADAVG